MANFDASSWLWSTTRGEVDRVNGVTARVDTRTKIQDAQNHEIQITQTDRYLVLRDLNTGQVSALDLTTLQISAVMPSTPGLGVIGRARRRDGVRHRRRAGADPPARPAQPGPDRRLDHVAPRHRLRRLRRQGHALDRRADRGHRGRHQPRRGRGASPKVIRTITVADPGHDLVLVHIG